MEDWNLNIFTAVISTIAIVVAVYGIFSKRPRVFCKVVPVFNDDVIDLNMHITNCGDKPSFDVNVTVYDNLESYINTYNSSELLEINWKLSTFKKNMTKTPELKYDHMILENDLNNYNIKKEFTKKHLSKCFNYDIKFLNGGETEIRFLGRKSDNKGYLNKNFKMNLNISFSEDLKIGFVSKWFISAIVSTIFYIYLFICNSCYTFGLYSPYFYNIYFYFKFISDFKFKLGKDTFKINLNNKSVTIYHSYNDIITINDLEYPYKAVDREMDKKMDILCDYVKIKSKNIFFNDILYKTWESKLTKDEFNIMRKYRLLYGNNYYQYIKLFERLYEINCDKEIKNKEGFKKKYVSLMLAMNNSNMLSEKEKNNIKRIHLQHDEMRINKGEHNERKKRRK